MFHMTLPREPAKPEARTASVEAVIPYTETVYLNKTGKAVYIKDRHGAYQAIPPLPPEANLDGKFHVVVSWHTTLYAQLSFDHQETFFSKTDTPLVCRRAAMRYTLSPSDYVGDDPIFSRDLGLIVSFNRPLNISDVFPDTSQAVTDNSHYSTAKLGKVVDLTINIVIVDNINPGVPYYLNIENRVYKIYSVVSEDAGNLPDGVHIIDTRRPVDGNSEPSYKLKDCIYDGTGKYDSPFTVFVNPHDARTNGHRNALIEARAHELELELKERDRELLGLKTLVQKAKEEAALRKENLDALGDARKDYYEGRSYSRKDSSESLSATTKFIAGMCALATTVLGVTKLLL